jgi:hypothetical protein
MRYDSGATQKVKEKMREAMTRHFTESRDEAQAGATDCAEMTLG